MEVHTSNCTNEIINTAAPPPPPQPKEEDLHRMLPTTIDEIEGQEWFVVDLKTATAANIHNISWDNVIGFTASEEGSEGVLFVQQEDGSVFLVKGSSTVAADMFAMELAAKTKTPVPKYRVLRCGVDDEYEILSNKLNEIDERNNPLHRNRHQKALNHPVITLMEFVAKNKALHDVGPKVFDNGSLGEQGTTILKEIARMTIFDVVINNWDRVPLIWDNNGNPDNILCVKKSHEFHVVAIDNSITSIDPTTLEENFLEYLDKVRHIVNEICYHAGVEKIFSGVRDKFEITAHEKQPSVQNIMEFLQQFTSYEVVTDRHALSTLIIGLIEGIVVFSKVTSDDLHKIRDQVESQICGSIPKMGMEVMHKVNLDFVDSVLGILRTAAPQLMPVLTKLEEYPSSGPAQL